MTRFLSDLPGAVVYTTIVNTALVYTAIVFTAVEILLPHCPWNRTLVYMAVVYTAVVYPAVLIIQTKTLFHIQKDIRFTLTMNSFIGAQIPTISTLSD